MADPLPCPFCRREPTTAGGACSYCARPPLGTAPLPPGPRLAPLMDALPAEEDRLTARPPRRSAPAPRPRLNPEEIESPEERSRAKGSMAFEVGMGLLCIAGGAAWFVGGLSLGVFFKYPLVLLIGGVGLIVDGVRRKAR